MLFTRIAISERVTECGALDAPREADTIISIYIKLNFHIHFHVLSSHSEVEITTPLQLTAC